MKHLLLPPSKTMEELNFSGNFQSDATVSSIMRGSPELRMLDLRNSELIEKPSFSLDGGSFAKIEVLVLNQCCRLLDEVVTNAANVLPNLRHLSCNDYDSRVRPVIRSTSLNLLDLSNCSTLLTDAKATQWLFCPNLTILYLGMCRGLTDVELENIKPHLNSLVSFRGVRVSTPTAPNAGDSFCG
jgi:hypothetical protein